MIKKIECFVPRSKVEVLKNELIHAGVYGMSVSNVLGFGRQMGHEEEEPSSTEVKLLEKAKIEVVVEEEYVEEVIARIVALSRRKGVGSGKIFVLPVEDAIRIGTGEVGVHALR